MIKSVLVVGLGGLALALAGCDVEQTDEGSLPDVNVTGMPEVNATGGDLPNVDVDAADVDMGTETKTVEVPDIDVGEADAGAQGAN